MYKNMNVKKKAVIKKPKKKPTKKKAPQKTSKY